MADANSSSSHPPSRRRDVTTTTVRPPRASFVRPPAQAWLCSACGQRSHDARHVCEHCVAVEPGWAAGHTASAATQQAVATAAVTSTSSSSSVRDCYGDAGAQLLTVAHTGRVYRIVTEPVRGDAPPQQQLQQDADEAAATPEHDDDDSDDDEPACAPARVLTLDQIVQRAGEAAAATVASNTPDASSQHQRGARRRRGGRARAYTHFVSLPLGKMPAMAASVERLLASLRMFVQHHSSSNSSGSNAHHAARLSSELVLRAPARLHMTLLLLTLDSDDDVALARQLLQQHFVPAWQRVKARLLQQQQQHDNKDGVRVCFGPGLHVMPDARSGRSNAARARVVYMAPRERDGDGDTNTDSSRDAHVATTTTAVPARVVLRELQHTLRTTMREVIDDMADAERNARTPHVTLLNAKWRNDAAAATTTTTTTTTKASASHVSDTFDATALLAAFAHACIGGGDDGSEAVPLTHIELCRRGGDEDADTHAYAVECSVSL